MMKAFTFFASAFLLFLVTGLASAQQSDRDQGIDLYREGKFSDAALLLEKATAVDKGDRVAWIFLGGSYVHQREEGKANSAFNKSRVKPTTAPPKYDKSVKITFKPRATYTERARNNMSSGTVTIAVEFKSDGSIGFAFPLQTTLDGDLIRQSVDAARGMRFEPAEKDGKPVTVINMVVYGFNVR